MGSHARIPIRRDLLDAAKPIATAAGYDSVDEYVEHLLEQDLRRRATATDTGGTDDDEAARKALEERMRGLGYL